jgi:microcystin-dependent protein
MARRKFSPSHQDTWDIQRLRSELMRAFESLDAMAEAVRYGTVPVGAIIDYGAALQSPTSATGHAVISGSPLAPRRIVAPPGWLWCNGQEVSRERYKKLYGAIGDSFGPSSSPQVFKVPDMRDRSPYGVGSTLTTPGAVAGASTMGTHSHTLTNARASVALENGLAYADTTATGFTSSAQKAADWGDQCCGPRYGTTSTGTSSSLTLKAHGGWGDRDRKVLIVSYRWLTGGSAVSISTATFKGSALTMLHGSGSGTSGAAWWYYLSPVGPGDVVITMSGSLSATAARVLQAFVLSGVRSQAPEAKSGSGTTWTSGTSSTPSTSVTTVSSGSAVIDCVSTGSNSSTIPSQTNQTEHWQGELAVSNAQTTHSEKAGPVTPGATTMAWTLGASVAWLSGSASFARTYAEPANSAKLAGTTDTGGGGSLLHPVIGTHFLIFAGE